MSLDVVHNCHDVPFEQRTFADLLLATKVVEAGEDRARAAYEQAERNPDTPTRRGFAENATRRAIRESHMASKLRADYLSWPYVDRIQLELEADGKQVTSGNLTQWRARECKRLGIPISVFNDTKLSEIAARLESVTSVAHEEQPASPPSANPLIQQFVVVANEMIERIDECETDDWTEGLRHLTGHLNELQRMLKWGETPAFSIAEFVRAENGEEHWFGQMQLDTTTMTGWAKDAIYLLYFRWSEPSYNHGEFSPSGSEGILYKRCKDGTVIDTRKKRKPEATRTLKRWVRFANNFNVLAAVATPNPAEQVACSTVQEDQQLPSSEPPTAPPPFDASADWIMSAKLGEIIKVNNLSDYRKEATHNAEDKHGKWGIDRVGTFRRRVSGNNAAYYVPELAGNYRNQYEIWLRAQGTHGGSAGNLNFPE